MEIRKATISDALNIQGLINYYAEKDIMLPRSINEIYDNIRDFWLCEDNGALAGCCALHVAWEDLAEIKSLAVKEEYHTKGMGKNLVLQCINDAKLLGIRKIFALSYVPDFFKKMGFKEIPKEKLPHKIWSECIKCPKFPNCGEIALLYKLQS